MRILIVGATREEVERTMREAISFHLEGLRADGYEVPEPTSYATYVEVAA
jgi:predicted RNase H-like HicB family nuclease